MRRGGRRSRCGTEGKSDIGTENTSDAMTDTTAAGGNPLEQKIRRLIAAAGPMPISEYMRLCLTEPDHGYYLTRDPIGSRGDFVTAPEVSQMFGELIGLWMAAVWHMLGAPDNIRIVELGPGRGTLMADALRAARVMKGFHAAIVLHLVEVSPFLRKAQERRLAEFDIAKWWHDTLSEVPAGPVIMVGNEFIDALPVRQAIKTADGWHERLVAVSPAGQLTIEAADDPLPHFEATLPPQLRGAADGLIYEWRADDIGFEIGRRVRDGGAALFIDYGHVAPGFGETLQAVTRHGYADPLRAPGEVDLTAHVDFAALGQRVETMGARAHGPVTQRDFLLRLGIEKRAATLKARASKEKVPEIDSALARLTAPGRGMGKLFKVLGVADPKLASLPAFEP
jgi:SAM-dependent MidA family methyltransferase